MKNKAMINIDKLVICYLPQEELTEKLGKLKKGEACDFKDFQIIVTNQKYPDIYADLVCEGETYGHFIFQKDKVLFQYDNEALYTEFCKDLNGQKSSLHIVGEQIMSALNLEATGISTLELAIDCNKSPQLRALVSDYTNYDMYLNGKRIDEDEAIPNYKEYFGRSRKTLQKNPTVYFGQARKDGIQFKLYDKTREIELASGKNYIKGWNEFKGNNIYRLEVSIGNKQWKEWVNYAKDNLKGNYKLQPNEEMEGIWGYNSRNIFQLANDEVYKVNLWDWLANRVLYFVDKTNKEKVTLFDLCAAGWRKPHLNKRNKK